jgi:hypothetical protein
MRQVGSVLLVALSVALVAPRTACAAMSPEQAYVDALIDALVQDGVITAERAREIKESAKQQAEVVAAGEKPKTPSWYDTLKVSGYVQARYQYQPDAGQGDNDFLIRRARVKLNAKPTNRTEVQVQVDLGEGSVDVKDAWVQQYLDGDRTLRARAGQQQLPFGFDTAQSASRLIPLERNWTSRRMVPEERDTGLTLFWTHPDDRELFEYAKENEWGTGDCGTVAVGVYNGQGNNVPEVNDQKHVLARVAKPFWVGEERYAEAGASYYGGTFYSSGASRNFHEHLYGAHFYLSPHPVGLLAEYYRGDTEGDDVDGWSAMGLWRPNSDGVAFVRYDEYNGPRKGKGIGNVYDRERWSIGYAHNLDSKTELTVEYDIMDTASGSDDTFAVQLQGSF